MGFHKSTESTESPLDDVVRKFRGAMAGSQPVGDLKPFIEMLDRFHETPGDEKEKLRQKDQLLVNLFPILQQAGLNFLQALLLTFNVIEQILWELKGEKGPVPKPQPPKPDSQPYPPDVQP